MPNAPKFKGPPVTATGYVPEYVANGTQFHLVSLAAFLLLAYAFPEICVDIYTKFSSILAVLNVTALGLCWYVVMVKPGVSPEDPKDLMDHGGDMAAKFFKGMQSYTSELKIIYMAPTRGSIQKECQF